MKITKRQLRKLINEETSSLLIEESELSKVVLPDLESAYTSVSNVKRGVWFKKLPLADKSKVNEAYFALQKLIKKIKDLS